MEILKFSVQTCSRLTAIIFLIATIPPVSAQDTSRVPQKSEQEILLESIQALRDESTQIRAMIEDMKTEITRSRTEAAQLRRELEITREQLKVASSRPGENSTVPPKSVTPVETQNQQEALQKLEEDYQLLNAKIDDQYQTKVESASKYRVRLSGAVFLNLFGTRGAVDNLDFPAFVLEDRPGYSRGSFAASVRQSQLGFDLFGPRINGKQVTADVQFDFAGGFPNAPDGVTFPLPRLRTAMVRLISPATTIAAGQDVPFFSPLSPSSIASVSVPAFSYSGNLWTWTPQVRVEHQVNVGASSRLLLQGGILDPLTGGPPPSQFFRVPQAGEASRQPAYATHLVWTRPLSGRELSLGGGGYYSRQSWGSNRSVDGWADTADWIIPVTGPLELSGEFYYGRAIGGLGGGLGRSVVLSGPITDPLTQVKPLNSRGGWTQLKFRQTERLEWNGAYGQDNILARDLRLFPLVPQTYYDPSIARNRSALLNFVYRPRSDVLLSLEYRHLQTFRISGDHDQANQINLTMGVLF